MTSAKTAIKGTVSDATGETYGVVGISNSPNGAGMAAGNTGGGADLVLDGIEDGDLDTVFTQAGMTDKLNSSFHQNDNKWIFDFYRNYQFSVLRFFAAISVFIN